jgi:hypothetical protein
MGLGILVSQALPGELQILEPDLRFCIVYHSLQSVPEEPGPSDWEKVEPSTARRLCLYGIQH